MKLLHYIPYYFLIFLIFSCHQDQGIPTVDLTPEPPKKDTILSHIDSLKNICRPGDLLVRLGDDFISDRIRYFSTKDKSYSHAGIIVMHNNKKMVCHIYPDDFIPGADTVRYDIIDSFLNTRTNLKCALYRYDLSDSEKAQVQAELNQYHDRKVHFDKTYDLETNDNMYCSEMIYKALKKITNDRIVIAQANIPENMQHLVAVFFKRYNPDKKTISKRKFISIDDLYINPHCRFLMKFALKAMP